MSDLPKLIIVLGPTASGKSALGIALAEKFGGEIVVCDSTQVYRHFDIGTAKVPKTEQRGIAHHLVDLIEPAELFTAGEYRSRAISALDDLRERGKIPIITAGTGLYLRALIEGLSDAPTRSEELRERLRERAKTRGHEYLHKLLARIDSEAAARIAPRDTPKIIRAIEIRLLAGKTVGDVHRGGRSALEGYSICKIGLLPSRQALYGAIDARVKAMIAAGWIEEVRKLIAMGVPSDAKPFQFIGYTEIRERLEEKVSLETTVSEIQQATRRFAKRQITWFRREPNVHWLHGFGTDAEVAGAALDIARSSSEHHAPANLPPV